MCLFYSQISGSYQTLLQYSAGDRETGAQGELDIMLVASRLMSNVFLISAWVYFGKFHSRAQRERDWKVSHITSLEHATTMRFGGCLLLCAFHLDSGGYVPWIKYIKSAAVVNIFEFYPHKMHVDFLARSI